MTRDDRDPYEVLGLQPTATSVEIRAAYLRLAKKHHPDKNPGDKASEWIFKEVGRAYETLCGVGSSGGSRRNGARREADDEGVHTGREGQTHQGAERKQRERQERTSQAGATDPSRRDGARFGVFAKLLISLVAPKGILEDKEVIFTDLPTTFKDLKHEEAG